MDISEMGTSLTGAIKDLENTKLNISNYKLKQHYIDNGSDVIMNPPGRVTFFFIAVGSNSVSVQGMIACAVNVQQLQLTNIVGSISGFTITVTSDSQIKLHNSSGAGINYAYLHT